MPKETASHTKQSCAAGTSGQDSSTTTCPARSAKLALPARSTSSPASPLLFKGSKLLRRGADFAHHALIEAGDSHRTQHLQWLTWRRWLDTHDHAKLEPKRWLYFNYAHQILQAALTGQGVALARTPLVADSLASGDLVVQVQNVAYERSRDTVVMMQWLTGGALVLFVLLCVVQLLSFQVV